MAVKRSIYITLIGSFLFAFAIVANGQTKEELEKLKEKFVKKYNYLKEKYYILKHQNKEKDGIIQVYYPKYKFNFDFRI